MIVTKVIPYSTNVRLEQNTPVAQTRSQASNAVLGFLRQDSVSFSARPTEPKSPREKLLDTVADMRKKQKAMGWWGEDFEKNAAERTELYRNIYVMDDKKPIDFIEECAKHISWCYAREAYRQALVQTGRVSAEELQRMGKKSSGQDRTTFLIGKAMGDEEYQKAAEKELDKLVDNRDFFSEVYNYEHSYVNNLNPLALTDYYGFFVPMIRDTLPGLYKERGGIWPKVQPKLMAKFIENNEDESRKGGKQLCAQLYDGQTDFFVVTEDPGLYGVKPLEKSEYKYLREEMALQRAFLETEQTPCIIKRVKRIMEKSEKEEYERRNSRPLPYDGAAWLDYW